MPINPQIYAPQIQPMQLENPMAFAKNALLMKQAQSEIAANELAARQAAGLNAMITKAQAEKRPLTPQDLISAGYFKPAKELTEAQNALLTGQKTEGELIGTEMNLSRRLLEGISALPPAEKARAYVAWHETQHQNPVLQKYFNRLGIKKEEADARIQAALAQPNGIDRLIADSALGLDKSMEQVFQQMDLGGTKEIVGFPKYGGGAAQVVPGSQRTVTASPNRPVTNILPTAKKFGEKFGEKAAEQFDTLYTQAQGAEQSINLSRQLKPLLNNPDFISGTLANVRLELAKALDLPGAEETQAYFAGIGGQVAQIIKSFGAGTGLSDADRKFAERMAGGSEELTTDAIKRIVRLNDEASKFVLKKYNTRRSELSRKDKEIADYYPEVRAVVREGTIKSGPDKGRRVVEYSDGTSEYAD